ncbi:MAG: SUF system Fe-S cluster assembly regulator [Geminicoccaceae bacterium]|nr:SUF system Fe-S cluster assembly regulator [Geminicoccaceae bacterium]MCB9945488.1 SUF system Fe-S cluster assembly regulator [Geminicoccaceae bacterium]
MIRLSKLADYGIVMMTHLAREQRVHGRSDEEGAQSSAQAIASATAIPLPMASKILKLLCKAALLRSQRGARGGYELASAASAITVADIIEALDGPIALTACVEDGDNDCGIEALCPARSNWQKINGAIRDALDGITLQDMAESIPQQFMLDHVSERHGLAQVVE